MLTLRSTPLRILLAASMAAVAGCRDTLGPTAGTRTPEQARPMILDGAHNNGSRAVFWLPPMVKNPAGTPGFGDAFRSDLAVSFRIVCVKCAVDASNRPIDKTIKEFPTTTVKVSTTEGHYSVNWDTKSVDLDATKTYQIQVRIGAQILAFADVDVVDNGRELKNVDSGEFIPLLDGRTLPIKVRIEQGVKFCKDVGSCASQIVDNTPDNGTYTNVVAADGEGAAFFPAHWFDPAEAGTDQVIVTAEDVTEELNAPGGPGCGIGKTVMHSAGAHCVRFSTEPRVTFTNTVIVMVCQENRNDKRQQLLKYDVDEAPTFLRNVTPPLACPEHHGEIGSTQRSSNPMVNLAMRVANAVRSFVVPKNAYAIDVGVGGAIDSEGAFSIVTVGYPLDVTEESGNGQTGPVGTTLEGRFQILVQSLHDRQFVPGAGDLDLNALDVTCTVTGGGGSFVDGAKQARAENPSEADESDGVYTCPQFQLGATPGTNTVVVSVANVDPKFLVVESTDREGSDGDPLFAAVEHPGTVTFTATGVVRPVALVDCPPVSLEATGDQTFRGFYVPSYPGTSLRQATLYFASDVAGSYTLSLTARATSYDGALIGTSNATTTLVANRTALTPTTFVFDNVSVAPGTRVTFAISVVSQPEGSDVVFYGTQTSNGSCPVIQTNDTSPPLSSFRRNGVTVRLFGDA